ncbi:NmrA/HSCARG family protein [Cyclobacterium plantarum]|uniref:NmrA/HSCARG family protein n=1 Tax=Cyclobacterium plantarum TaxID=2716263 RepID=A0ABX0H9E5_9BACT|nr:NmrA/HSCARG family protein [Cyclobacterium plantarum]NHE56600.1 NmrA/HSCARG family protein [Cyclobacterium plantarum]
MSKLNTIVVCGATGKQGGAVLDALLESGKWNPVAITRDIRSQKATEIKGKGVPLLFADLADKPSLVKAFKGAYAVYGVTMPVNPRGKLDTEYEWKQGQNMVDACVANNIQHLVLSTVLYIEEDQENNLTYIKKKVAIENLVKEKNIPFTFLCPGSFMDDFGGEYLPVKKNIIRGMASNDTKIPHIACRDIGKFAAMAFEEPGKFVGQKLNLIGDFMSGNELAALASKLSNGKTTYKHKPVSIVLMWLFARTFISLRRHFERWGQAPYPDEMLSAIKQTKELRPETLTFAQYLKWKGWDKRL